MTWPTTIGARPLDVGVAWEMGRSAATNLKAAVTKLHDSSPIDTRDVVSLVATLHQVANQLAAVATVDITALTAFARAQLNDPTFDASVELPAIRAAVASLLSWFVTNTPQSVDGYLLLVKYDSQGALQWRLLSGAQQTAINAQLATLLAALN